MKCRVCGNEVPESGGFCTNCGTKIEPVAPVTPPVAPQLQPTAPIQQPVQAKKKLSPLLIPVIILGVFVMILGSLNIVQLALSAKAKTAYKDVVADRNSLRTEVKNLEKTVDDKNDEIEQLYQINEYLLPKADNYDNLVDAINEGPLGYAADYFQMDESIVIMNLDQVKSQVTLTAHWKGGGTVSTANSNPDVATISFDSSNWKTTTTMTITANAPGVSRINFANNATGETFNIIIIVLE